VKLEFKCSTVRVTSELDTGRSRDREFVLGRPETQTCDRAGFQVPLGPQEFKFKYKCMFRAVEVILIFCGLK
jgi:hypothetical protein